MCLISEAIASLAALVMKQRLGISYPSSRLFAFKYIHAMAECQSFCCSVQIDDVCSGYKFRSSNGDNGSENKICFDTVVSLSDQEYSLNVKLASVPVISEEAKNSLISGCLTLFDDLARSEAVCQHRAVNIDRHKLKYLLHFVYIKAIAGDPQNQSWSRFSCLYFQQYALFG
jgi:hypothetical protein